MLNSREYINIWKYKIIHSELKSEFRDINNSIFPYIYKGLFHF
jgi:hypothetical protein